MMDEIKVGDVVVLRSGGCRMTVTQVEKEKVDGISRVRCDWFVPNDNCGYQHDCTVFPIVALQKVKSES